MYHGQVKIFARSASPRLNYIAGIIFGNILGSDWKIITDARDAGNDPVINYSNVTFSGSLRIKPHRLIFENEIHPIEISAEEWKGIPAFFLTDEDSDMPFDIFAASFYLVSRYEEYLSFEPDRFGRFPARTSFAFRNGFLRIPVVDLWAKQLADILILKYPGFSFRKNEYNALLTIDVDQPFAYLGKSLFRTAGGLMRDLVVRPRIAGERVRVVSGREKDPYDVFDYITRSIDASGTDARFFFPAGRITEYDKNPPPGNNDYRKLIISISGKYKSGFHPSFYASDNYSVFDEEMRQLAFLMNRDITISRFHFLRIKLPESCNILEKAGISEDYSMGFPDEPGFRAGTARPFMFYNLREERQTGLRMIPLPVMDATLYKYLKLDPHKAEEVIVRIITEVRKVGGLFVSLWHNTSLTDKAEWEGWRKLFEKMLIIQKP